MPNRTMREGGGAMSSRWCTPVRFHAFSKEYEGKTYRYAVIFTRSIRVEKLLK